MQVGSLHTRRRVSLCSCNLCERCHHPRLHHSWLANRLGTHSIVIKPESRENDKTNAITLSTSLSSIIMNNAAAISANPIKRRPSRTPSSS
mmetsp:Transcript_33887/g.99870  ORF Transcript_33887/g.99870 Transcript_33887/m.99870 type:complete len:91 (-) Transcript_33887:806-1078(-)